MLINKFNNKKYLKNNLLLIYMSKKKWNKESVIKINLSNDNEISILNKFSKCKKNTYKSVSKNWPNTTSHR
jgi:hypothetical protein